METMSIDVNAETSTLQCYTVKYTALSQFPDVPRCPGFASDLEVLLAKGTEGRPDAFEDENWNLSGMSFY